MSDTLNTKIVSASKWSSITEIVARMVSPLSTMLLARILAPDAFGILVTALMVISFAEIFTDAGFQKYLIQHEFEDNRAKYQATTVAFWANFVLSMFIWLIIIIFANPLATLVGCPGHADVIIISCVCIPLAAFSSIQMALYKRSFDFRTLFFVRLIGVLIPIFITVPIAYFTKSFWALIIGMIALNMSNAIILTIKSEWKPRWYFDFNELKKMLSFSIWSMFEAVSIWLTSYIDIFIVGTFFNQYYLGLYRTSITTVGQIMALITAATTPILFSSLSRLQDNKDEFKQMFFKFQKIVGFLVIPLGVGIFLFRNFITTVILGSQWEEASLLIGLWGLTNAITIVLAHYSSEVYRSLGKPKISTLIQLLHIVFLVPTVIIAIRYDYETLCIARSLIRLQSVAANILVMHLLIQIDAMSMFKNLIVPIGGACMMIIVAYILPLNNAWYVQLLYIIIVSIAYLATIMMFREGRRILFDLKNQVKL